MSKGITIKEGRIARTFTDVAKVRVNDPDGGSNLWVPEDEVLLVPKTVTRNGIYNADDDEAYGYSFVSVSVDLPTKNITKNGTYKASSDNRDGWSKIVVNVEEKSASGTDTSGNPYEFDSDGTGVTLTTNEGDYGVEVGTDPETGEATMTLTKLPKRIEFVASQQDISDGDALDLSQFTVYAYWNDQGSWTNVTSQCSFSMENGTILSHDASPYTLTATYNAAGEAFTADVVLNVEERGGGRSDLYTLPYAQPILAIQSVDEYQDNILVYRWVLVAGGKITCGQALNRGIRFGFVDIIGASPESGGVIRRTGYNSRGEIVEQRDFSMNQSFTYDGKTVYYTNNNIGADSNTTVLSPNLHDLGSFSGSIPYDNIAWTLIYGR